MKARRPARPVPGSIGPARTALLAVLGSSPAVLTETLWALAQETPPILPDSVVVVTTTTGRSTLRQQLLSPMPTWKGRTVWQALRTTLLGKNAGHDRRLQLETPIVIGLPNAESGTLCELEDIRTGTDNAAAAETILTAVRRFTTDADTRLIGLLAGGRKTMGALLHAALSLAGRPGDRLLHVLVNEPFDHPKLSPLFFFRGQPGPTTHNLPDGAAFTHAGAHIEIADVPLVALGELIAAQSGHLPATFASLSRAADAALDNAKAAHSTLTLAYDVRSRQLRVDHYACEIPAGRPAALCAALCADVRADAELVDRKTLEVRWGTKDPHTGQPKVTYLRPDGTRSAFTEDDISNALNVVREALLTRAQAPSAIVERLFPRRQAIGLNRDRVTIAE
jgi:CRISPR-associated protein (TIGR02584 family)